MITLRLDELYQIIGEKTVVIFKLEQQVKKLSERIAELEKPDEIPEHWKLDEDKGITSRRPGNGEADPRETFQSGI